MAPLLRIAEWLFGPEERQRTFDPMLADRAREIADAGSHTFWLRIRWAAAIALAFLMSAPRAFTLQMPLLLRLDVIGCAVAIPAMAFIYQWSYQRFDVRSWSTWQYHFAAALPYTVIPIVWRFRVAAIPEDQRRRLTRSFIVLVSALTLGLGADRLVGSDWWTRAAHVVSILWLAACGWYLGKPTRIDFSRRVASSLLAFAIVTACLFVALWPLRAAIGLRTPISPLQIIFVCAMAGTTVMTLKKRFNGFTSIGP